MLKDGGWVWTSSAELGEQGTRGLETVRDFCEVEKEQSWRIEVQSYSLVQARAIIPPQTVFSSVL